MSQIQARIGNRYNDIIGYFKRCPFGTYPPDMTALSGLPPVDRCLILERVLLECRCDVLALIDKLSMAYLKAGWKDLALLFLDAAKRRGLMSGDAYSYFYDKILDLDGVRLSSKTYGESIHTIKGDRYMAPDLCELLIELCRDYSEDNVFQSVDFTSALDAGDIAEFMNERRAFIRLVAGV